MDKIVLGLLMLQRLTLYEIRATFKLNFWAICSDSTGSIQAAIKKLLAAEMITFTEYVEKSVNKKRYAITQKGRDAFLAWVKTPANLAGPSGIELGKLLFMGLIPQHLRAALIDEIIADTEREIALHLELQDAINGNSMDDVQGAFFAMWAQDPEYHQGIRDATQSDDDAKNIKDIAYFQKLALKYGIGEMQFIVQWFKKLKKDLESEEN